MLKIHSVPTGLHCHINKIVKETKQREICFKMQKELDEIINQVGRENLLSKMRKFDFDKVFSSIKENRIFKNINKAFEGQGLLITKIAFTSIFALVANPFMTYVFASQMDVTIRQVDSKMLEVCKMIFTLGGWGFVCFSIKEIIECMIKKDNASILSIIIKYVIAFIAMLLMPKILSFARMLILGS